MATSTFDHRFEIAAPPAEVVDFLIDLHNHTALHPLIESIRDLPSDPARPDVAFYEIVDRVPFGPLRLKATYRAAIELLGERAVGAEAWQRPGVYLRTNYDIEPSLTGSVLIEQVSVSAPWLLHRFVATQAERAHAKSLAGMKELLENVPR